MPLLSIARQNPLIYPSRVAGYNSAHLAAQSVFNETISVVPRGNSFATLTNFGVNSSSAGTQSFSGTIGPYVSLSGAQVYAVNSIASAIALNLTMAAIVQPSSVSGNQAIITPTQTASFASYFLSAGVPSIFFGSATISSGLSALSANTPYFVAVSISPNNVANFLVENLLTGVIATSSPSTSGKSMPAFSAYVAFGNNAATAGSQAFPGLGPAMLSCGYLSVAQLRQWATDPWSFWYPRLALNIVGIASAPALVNFRKTLSMYGSGVGKRQSQAA